MIPQEAADEFVSKPFKYHHLGSLAYIGNAAVFDLGNYSFMGGLVSFLVHSKYRCRTFLMAVLSIYSGPCMLGDLSISTSR